MDLPGLAAMDRVPLLWSLLAGSVALVWLFRLALGWRSRATRRYKLATDAKLAVAKRDKARQDWERTQARVRVRPEVLKMSATELLEAMSAGRLSSVGVMTALCQRASEVGKELNTNTEECFAEALQEAEKCDAERAEGRLRGPLHGLPISIKDQFHQAGWLATCGLQCRCATPAKEDGLLVGMMRAAGAIPFVRTNVPQCLMLPESANNVWGRSANPFNRACTVGGSSGGEAGLIAAGGSVLGLGSDIGGSIRIPAHFCGIAGFKPTPQRVTRSGMASPRPNDQSGQNAVISTAGPMARTVQDLELVMKTWCQDRGDDSMWVHDPDVPPLPWKPCSLAVAADGQADQPKLKFGYFTQDQFFTAAPACVRAVEKAVEALEEDGHEVVRCPRCQAPAECRRRFELNNYEAALTYVGLMAAEGNMHGFHDGLEGEPLHPMYTFLSKIASVPNFVRPVIAGVLRALGQPRIADLVTTAAQKGTYEFWEFTKKQKAITKHVITSWQEAGLDALICPGLGLPAWKHGLSEKLNQACSYTFFWNLVHFPAGTVPFGRVLPSEDGVYDSPYHDTLASAARLGVQGSAGLPVGVQVVTLPWQDEKCLEAMHVVECARRHLDPDQTTEPTFGG